MMTTSTISTDDTHISSVANPSALKKASGDSSSGMDAATIKAVAENLVINGAIDLSAIQMIQRDTLSHLNNNKITSLSAGKGSEKRSEKISELALGMDPSKFKSTRVDSLGDLMCELMVLMIQSTSERQHMEREMRTILSVAQVDQSKVIAGEILQKAELEAQQIKTQAWVNLATTVVSSVGSIVGSVGSTPSGRPTGIGSIGKLIQSSAGFINAAGGFATAGSHREIATLDASIQRKKTALNLTRSVARSVENSLKDIDSTREHFMSMITQITQTLHDNKMQIIRNSVV